MYFCSVKSINKQHGVMKAIQTNGIRINEFETRVNVIAEYRGKKVVVSCVTIPYVNENYEYQVWNPRDIKRLDKGTLTDNMRYEASCMMRDLVYEMK